MTFKIQKPINKLQTAFNDLCDKGGGTNGGPARTKVQELLHEGSKNINRIAYSEITAHLAAFSDRNPWHVCFAVGLCWGHLADIHLDFTDAATKVLASNDDRAVKEAQKFCLDRGPEPIEKSLRGGYLMLQKVRLPISLPATLEQYGRAQERWMQPLLSITEPRPKYIGSWNATAMFMVALFSNPDLGAKLKNREVMLPPNGPVGSGLSILHKAHVLHRPPAGGTLDDGSFEPGVIYENNALMAELTLGRADCSTIDIHSGLYLLGTRYPLSKQWE